MNYKSWTFENFIERFDLLQIKQVLISNKRNILNEFLNQLPNKLRLSILGVFKILEKYQN